VSCRGQGGSVLRAESPGQVGRERSGVEVCSLGLAFDDAAPVGVLSGT
jgi:hypothetical protein